MSVDVTCEKELCKWNQDGECAAPVILINDEGECLDFEDYRK